eukprot:3325576-Amphidinium_carterae.1
MTYSLWALWNDGPTAAVPEINAKIKGTRPLPFHTSAEGTHEVLLKVYSEAVTVSEGHHSCALHTSSIESQDGWDNGVSDLVVRPCSPPHLGCTAVGWLDLVLPQSSRLVGKGLFPHARTNKTLVPGQN